MEQMSAGGQGAHGGEIIAMAARLGCRVADILDMSSNLTPLGMVPGLKEELVARLEEIAFLPEGGSETLARSLAGRCGLDPSQVLVGNGTTEFIYAVPAATSCTRVLVVAPTYGDYRPAGEWAGLAVDFFTLLAQDDFALDFSRLSSRLAGGELVFLCNPNNPTSRMVPSRTLLDFILAHPASDFVVDESYLPFVDEPSLASFPLPDNLFLLNSFSKIYGIPGLRLGFLLAGDGKAALLSGRRKPWGVNRLAQVAGEFLLAHGDDYAESVRRYVRETRPGFVAALGRLPGVRVVEGSANFILCRLEGSRTAADLRQAMLARRIMIRDCSNFIGLDPFYFRLSLKDPAGNQRCLDALTLILDG